MFLRERGVISNGGRENAGEEWVCPTETQSGNVLTGVQLEGLGCHCDGYTRGLVDGGDGQDELPGTREGACKSSFKWEPEKRRQLGDGGLSRCRSSRKKVGYKSTNLLMPEKLARR